MRIVLAGLAGIVVFALVSAQAAPVPDKAVAAPAPGAHAQQLAAQGCGPSRHRAGWRDAYGRWHWGRCVPY